MMSKFYYNMEASIDGALGDILQFGLLMLVIGCIAMVPSFFEKKQK